MKNKPYLQQINPEKTNFWHWSCICLINTLKLFIEYKLWWHVIIWNEQVQQLDFAKTNMKCNVFECPSGIFLMDVKVCSKLFSTWHVSIKVARYESSCSLINLHGACRDIECQELLSKWLKSFSNGWIEIILDNLKNKFFLPAMVMFMFIVNCYVVKIILLWMIRIKLYWACFCWSWKHECSLKRGMRDKSNLMQK